MEVEQSETTGYAPSRIAGRNWLIPVSYTHLIGANGLCSICFISQNVAARNVHSRKQIDGGTGIKDVSAGKQKVDAVSYTHLDVYKRQPRRRPYTVQLRASIK